MDTKVLHIITSLGEGGAQKILKEICLNNKEGTHRVVCFKTGRYKEELINNGVQVYFLDIKKNPLITFIKLIILINFRFKPNIIHTWMYHADLIGSFLKIFWFKKNKYLFWNVRNGTLRKGSSSFFTRRIRNFLSIFSYISPNKIIYCAESVKIIHESIGYNKIVGYVINNGVDTEYFSWYDRRNRIKDNYKIGFIGRYSKQKNIQILFNSLSFLNKQNVNFLLNLVGEKLDNKNISLIESIKALNIENKTRLYGIQTDIREILFKLDLLVLTSSAGEGFPNILLEAMSTGLRCISTDVGESKFIVDKFGWIIDPKDVNGLTKAIKESILQKDEDRYYFEKGSRKHIVKCYKKEIMLENYRNLYKNIHKTNLIL